MQKSVFGADIRALAESLMGSVRRQGGFSPSEVRNSTLLSEEARRANILQSLDDGPKTGHEIIKRIESQTAFGINVSPSSIYPQLENLADMGLLKVEVVKDRKTFTLTKTGRAALKDQNSSIPKNDGEPDDDSPMWLGPKWVDLRGGLANSSKRLAKVALEVSQYGTKEQQESAAIAIDEARKKIHEILAEK